MPSFWSAYAPIYDYLWSNPLTVQVGEVIAERAAIHGHEVVEVGSGSGLITRHLLTVGVRTTAYEPSSAMRKLFHQRLPDTPVHSAAIDRIPLAGHPRTVVAANVLHFTQHPECTLGHLSAIAGAGGIAIVLTPDPGCALGDARDALRRAGAPRRFVAAFIGLHIALAPVAVVLRSSRAVRRARAVLPSDALRLNACFVLAEVRGASPGHESPHLEVPR